jgi:hypothetical protein
MNMPKWLLPHLPADKIMAAYAAAGKEIESDKLSSAESSVALTANVFGYFIDRPTEFPLSAIFDETTEAPHTIRLESEQRFPWSGGHHPWLDVMIETDSWLIGIESRRYEPFRGCKPGEFSDAYRRPVWGDRMGPYEKVRDPIMEGAFRPLHLDCAQLVKPAFGIRTRASRRGKRGALVYVFAEPKAWPDGTVIATTQFEVHQAEMQQFADHVAGAEIVFRALSYPQLYDALLTSDSSRVRAHAEALRECYAMEMVA